MSVNSLPSFAQAFSSHPLSPTLPPLKRIHDDDVKQEDDQPVNQKKRRVTVSGSAPHPLRIDVRAPPQEAAPTPISPVVMGFTVPRDGIDQVRSMMSVKQKQKQLIEQRRGSLVDTGERRAQRPVSPQPAAPPPQAPPSAAAHPPPISFARRRAAQLGGKKKPADLLISPRDQETFPVVQSAPPTQTSFRFPMSLPRLPQIAQEPRRPMGNVPPTPTRLAMQPPATRSPPAPSVPIASTLVPPTPTHPTGDKAAFLAPFELFYEALHDSKQLKAWLADQVQKSQQLMQSLQQQQDRLSETVDALVEKRTAEMRSEMGALWQRVRQLEDQVRRPSPTTNGDHRSASPTGSRSSPPET